MCVQLWGKEIKHKNAVIQHWSTARDKHGISEIVHEQVHSKFGYLLLRATQQNIRLF